MSTLAQTTSGRAVVALHRLVGVVDAASAALVRAHTPYDLATVTFLAVLADAQQPVSPDGDPADAWVADLTTLAECLGVTRAAVSKRVPALVSQGLVRTSGDPHHARRIRVGLTAQGAALVDTATTLLETWLAVELAGRLDLDALHTVLTDALAALMPPTDGDTPAPGSATTRREP
ncbi:MarR family winged helix-turn-helix transcriptional regulator [Sanguibacter sp. A247]|uniref:MarR family winged helix-turn-helix transcriptional regulator n=1 Tax=unclassified Sanguibacter TaxID=2645534 RepID=UPI003FD6F32A